MRRYPIVTVILLLLASCRTDYDIGEVAPVEFTGVSVEHADSCSECSEEEHVHHHEEAMTGIEDVGAPERHVHEAGQRNHGTVWFFNQPWAASFIWGKMLRDSVILVVLAAVILLLSGRRRRHR